VWPTLKKQLKALNTKAFFRKVVAKVFSVSPLEIKQMNVYSIT